MENGITAPKRLPHIDLLKTLAIYFVLVFHGTLYNYLVYPDMTALQVLRFFFRTILSTCVPLFFFVNGYLLLPKPLDLKKHSRKTLRLMVVTCFWMLFLLKVLQPYYQEYFTWQEMGTNLWELHNGWNNQLWYLGILVGIYLIFPLLQSAFAGNRKVFYWFTAVVVFQVFGSDTVDLGVTLFNLLVKKEFYLYYNNLPVFYMFKPFLQNTALGLAYFCLGGVVWALEEQLLRIPALRRNLTAAVGLLVSCTVFGIIGWKFSLYNKMIWDVVWNGYDSVFTLTNVLMLYLLSLSWKRESRLLRLISANTLGIYLVHDLLHKAVTPLLNTLTVLHNLPGTLLYAAVLLLMTLTVCLILKKIPLVKHLI